MTNILVALDLGEASKQALEQAKQLAACFKGSLHLLCVVQSPFALPWAPAARHEELVTLLEQMEQDARKYLEGLLTPEERQTYRATLVTRVGKPAAQILEYARLNGITLIVCGKDGHGGHPAATAIGSVAQAVAREAPCPILLVPASV